MNIDLNQILDQLDEHLVLIDSSGAIQYVNNAWVAFGQANGIRKDFDWIGVDYLGSCKEDHGIDGSIAKDAAAGIRSVIEGTADQFTLKYPCHSPFEQRWFEMKVTPLSMINDDLYLLRHINTTITTVAQRLSHEDSLTGIHNRRYLEEFLDKEWRRCLRHKSLLSLIFLDLDNFKSVNDCFGHSAGDRTLIRFANLLGEYTRRPGDTAARLGGDEFALVIGESTFAEAQVTGAAIVRAVEQIEMPDDHSELVTASVGFVNGTPTADQEINSWWELADSLLYQAKSEGGNKVLGVKV